MDAMIIYIISINIIAFILYGIDKWNARKGLRRIPEKTLLTIAAVGGSVGAYGGMWYFRHKIRKPKFSIGVPVIFVIHVGILLYIYC